MTWIPNTDVGAQLWDAGAYLGAAPGTVPMPRWDLLPADAGEVDYLIGPAGMDLSTALYHDFDADSYVYRSGGGFYGSSANTSLTAPHLYVAFYNLNYDAPGTFTPSVAGSALVEATLAAGGTAGPPPSPPANDAFANRVVLPSGPGHVAADPSWATLEAGEDHYPATGQTTWYEWTVDVAGHFRLTVDSNLVVNVYRASVLGAGVLPASGSHYAELNVYGGNTGVLAGVAVGEVLYLQVDLATLGAPPAAGDGFAWQAFVPIANDDFANAQVLSGASGTVSGIDVTLATTEAGEPYSGGSVWYAWTAPSSGLFYFETSHPADYSRVDLTVKIFTGSTVSSLTYVTGYNGYGPRLVLNATSGTTYMLQVSAGSGFPVSKTGSINWGVASPPANDVFANRVVLSGASGYVDFDLTDATEDPNPYPVARGDIWYEWVAPSNDPVRFWFDSAEWPSASASYYGFDIYEVERRVVVPSADPAGPYYHGYYSNWSSGHEYLLNPRAGATYYLRLGQTRFPRGRLHWGVPLAPIDTTGLFGSWSDTTVSAPEFTEYRSHLGYVQGSSPVIGIGRVRWKRYVANFTGTLTLTAAPYVDNDFDYPGAAIAAYSGPLNPASPAELTLLGSANAAPVYSSTGGNTAPSAGPTATLAVPVTADQAIFIQTDFVTINGVSMTLSATAATPSPPPNDNIANATAITGFNGAAPLTTVSAGPDAGPSGSARTTWYRWVAPAYPDTHRRTVTFALSGPGSGRMAVYKPRAGLSGAPDPSQPTQYSKVGGDVYPGGSQDVIAAPGDVIYLCYGTQANLAENRQSLGWSEGQLYTVGPWLNQAPVAVSGYVPYDSNGHTLPAVDGLGSANTVYSRWVADQPSPGYTPLPYDSDFARHCAFTHAKAGDVLYHYDGYDFNSVCPVGHYNDALTSGGVKAGLGEYWDTGSFLVAAFYEMSIYASVATVDFSGALQRWSPGPTTGLSPGQIVETVGGTSFGNVYSNGKYAVDARTVCSLASANVNLAASGAHVETAFAAHLSLGIGAVPTAPPNNGFPQGSAYANQVDTTTLSPGATTFTTLVAPLTGGLLGHRDNEGTAPGLPFLDYAAYQQVIFCTSHLTSDSDAPPRLYTANTATSQESYATGSWSVSDVVVQPPQYRVLTPTAALENWDFPTDWTSPDFPDPGWDTPPTGTTYVRPARAQVHAKAEIQMPLCSPWDIPTLTSPWPDGDNTYSTSVPAGQGIRQENWALFNVGDYLVVRGEASPLPALTVCSRSAVGIGSDYLVPRSAPHDVSPGLSDRWLPDTSYTGGVWTSSGGKQWSAASAPIEANLTYPVSPIESLTRPAMLFDGTKSFQMLTSDTPDALTVAMVARLHSGIGAYYGLVEHYGLGNFHDVATTYRPGLRYRHDTLEVLQPMRAVQQFLPDLVSGRNNPMFIAVSYDFANRLGRLYVLGRGRTTHTFTLPSGYTQADMNLYLGRAWAPATWGPTHLRLVTAVMELFEVDLGYVALNYDQLEDLAAMMDNVYGITG